MAKAPGFPRKIGKPGAFCMLWAILAYLQLLSSVLLILGGVNPIVTVVAGAVGLGVVAALVVIVLKKKK